MNFGALPERLAHVRAEIARRQATAGPTEPVTIVAVPKGFGLGAGGAGFAPRPPAVGRAAWHLMGHLQRNKAKHVAGRFALIHSLDSAELADELDKRAAAQG